MIRYADADIITFLLLLAFFRLSFFFQILPCHADFRCAFLFADDSAIAAADY